MTMELKASKKNRIEKIYKNLDEKFQKNIEHIKNLEI